MNASATHPQLAPLTASTELPAPDSTPMIAQMPISEPRASTRLVQLTHLTSASWGTSMPAGREDASLVDLVAQRAGDREAEQVSLLRGVAHIFEHSPPSRSACM